MGKGGHCRFNRIDDSPTGAAVNYLGDRTAAKCERWRAACHGLDHDKTERFGPIDREKKPEGVTQKFVLVSLIDFANKLNVRVVKQGSNRFAKVSFIGAVYLRSDL